MPLTLGYLAAVTGTTAKQAVAGVEERRVMLRSFAVRLDVLGDLRVSGPPGSDGGMMWFMAKGMHSDRPTEQPERPVSDEHRRLRAGFSASKAAIPRQWPDKKRLLIRRRDGRTDIYRPAMTRDEYLEARAAAEVGALVDNYGGAALMHFARQMDQLDPERREQLRRLARG